jgi:prolyl-tRNA synthetase
MRWSQTFIPTLKETPADAEIISHQLLLRAGLVRKLTGGLYTFLPMGLRVLRKIERIVREEMNRAGGLEVLMPTLQPVDIWQASGRYESMGEGLFKLRDRTKKEFAISPTAEEVITTLAAGEVNSYRQMPINFYQVSVKLRDEIRPRFGLMRAKEFIMKDAYSFDVSDEKAMESYHRMYEAYKRIFDRCGLKNFPVEADTGVIGGNYSHEFMVPAATGENNVVYCEGCGYAANIEKATSGIPKTAAREIGAAIEKFATPGVVTIEALTKDPHKVPANRQIKTLVYVADSRLLLILIRGDDQLNETKLMARTGAVQARPATTEEIFALLGAHPGSLGAVNFSKADVRILADERLRGANDMTTGANEDGFHFRNVSIERDIRVTDWFDLRTVAAGEPCAKCGKPLKIQRAIEVGHVFKLGTKYSEKLNAYFVDVDGSRKPCVMGCYGIGVTRTMAAAIEQNHDDAGIIWPMPLAPFHVVVVPVNWNDERLRTTAVRLHDELEARGIDVLLDDREERPGVKFKDADLVGHPLRITVGPRALERGAVEVKQRTASQATEVPVDDAAAHVAALVAAAIDVARE